MLQSQKQAITFLASLVTLVLLIAESDNWFWLLLLLVSLIHFFSQKKEESIEPSQTTQSNDESATILSPNLKFNQMDENQKTSVRQILISKLALFYGKPKTYASGVKFLGVSQKTIAKFLEIDEPTLSRILKNPELAERSPIGIEKMEELVEFVDYKIKAIIRKETRTNHKRYFWPLFRYYVIIPLTAIALLLASLGFYFYQLNNEMVSAIAHMNEKLRFHEENIGKPILWNIDQVANLLEVYSMNNVPQLTKMAFEEVNHLSAIYNSADSIPEKVKLELLRKNYKVVKSFIQKSRRAIAGIDHSINGKIDFHDLMDKTYPIDSFYSIAPEEMLRLNHPPSEEKPFEAATWSVFQLIIDLPTDYKDFSKDVRHYIESVQQVQTVLLLEEAKKYFDEQEIVKSLPSDVDLLSEHVSNNFNH